MFETIGGDLGPLAFAGADPTRLGVVDAFLAGGEADGAIATIGARAEFAQDAPRASLGGVNSQLDNPARFRIAADLIRDLKKSGTLM